MAISKDFIFSNFSPFLNFFQNEKEIGEGCMCGAVRGLACFFFALDRTWSTLTPGAPNFWYAGGIWESLAPLYGGVPAVNST
jgi:hypothetical protein